ncbi:hypothetical protein SynBMKMC1_01187 [Synechococcus sp. BMK-MC-1]|nr:hypothetical protein SynBMKMC1_01187 [Synechococcus sp. BMK-MC-1]
MPIKGDSIFCCLNPFGPILFRPISPPVAARQKKTSTESSHLS